MYVCFAISTHNFFMICSMTVYSSPFSMDDGLYETALIQGIVYAVNSYRTVYIIFWDEVPLGSPPDHLVILL